MKTQPMSSASRFAISSTLAVHPNLDGLLWLLARVSFDEEMRRQERIALLTATTTSVEQKQKKRRR